MSEYQKQEILPERTRNNILKKIMMLKSWFDENMDVQLSWLEYNYVSESLIKQSGEPYSNRDLFDIQLWAYKVPALSGKRYREECDFDSEIEDFMNSVGLNWSYWGTCTKNKNLKELTMSELTIRNCIFAFKCSAVWEELRETADESIRFCKDCQKEVHYCADDAELAAAVRLNRCVAIEEDSADGWPKNIEMGLIRPL